MKALARPWLLAVLGLMPGAAWAKAPVVVELFTAQGCAPCNQANAVAAKLADRPGLIVLTFPVDYWDYLGWRDTFAQPEFTARQKAFGRRLGPRDVYTPQVIVNGAAQASGDDAAAVEALLTKVARPTDKPPKIRFSADGRVHVGGGYVRHGKAEVWLVRYDPKERDVEVKAGDNRGVTVALRDVVRQCVRLGAWNGHQTAYSAPAPSEPGLANVILIQGAHGGPVLGATRFRPRS
jgi:hypothetical protein